MTLILSLLLGALIGWLAFSLFRLNVQQGLCTSLLIGLVGGGLGMQDAVGHDDEGAPDLGRAAE
jgi:uncharacterized membrane protein YeaQ/YmgE (transglycosylase-associated protein family)